MIFSFEFRRQTQSSSQLDAGMSFPIPQSNDQSREIACSFSLMRVDAGCQGGWSFFNSPGIGIERAPGFCFGAFSSREPEPTSLENALGDLHFKRRVSRPMAS
jgi:hypothetical protein